MNEVLFQDGNPTESGQLILRLYLVLHESHDILSSVGFRDTTVFPGVITPSPLAVEYWSDTGRGGQILHRMRETLHSPQVEFLYDLAHTCRELLFPGEYENVWVVCPECKWMYGLARSRVGETCQQLAHRPCTTPTRIISWEDIRERYLEN